MKRYTIPIILFFMLIGVATWSGRVPGHQPPAVNAATDAVPALLVSQPLIDDITTTANKVWYWYWDYCPAPRGLVNHPTTQIARVPAFGGLTRSVYAEYAGVNCSEDTDIGSNIVADEEYLYWVSRYQDALVRLPVTANEGDTPTPIYNEMQVQQIRELGNWVYMMHSSYGIIRILKPANPYVIPTVETIVTPAELGTGASFWVTGNRVLWVGGGALLYQRPLTGGAITSTSNVSNYSAEVCLGGCSNEVIYVVKANSIWQYPVGQNGSVIYTSPIEKAEIVEIKVDANNIYFVEQREVEGGVDTFYDFGLYRLSRSGGNAALLYSRQDVPHYEYLTFHLNLGGPDDDYLFWHEHGDLKRLPRDADALPVVDVAVNRIEVTQGIQDFSQSIQLIKGKWTGVRVYAEAAGSNVPGVPAHLYRVDAQGNILDGPLSPTTNYMTVQDNPQREVLEDTFYFRLPHSWTLDDTLRLRAEVNPNRIPDEPNFANNVMSTAMFTLRDSYMLPVHLLLWEFEINGNTYLPDPILEVAQSRSWFQRVFPLASSDIYFAERVIVDEGLADRMLRIGDDCDALLTDDDDDRNLCASYYVNARAAELRATEEWKPEVFIYSMLYHDPGNPDLRFPRGSATSSRISSGPAGPDTFGWDFDGSSADFYMGHEIGHSVTAGHPLGMNDICDHSIKDENFPRSDLSIGAGTMWGFDVGAAGLNPLLVPSVLPNDQWTEVMGYCDNQWLSDYNYENIYTNLSNSGNLRPNYTPANAGDNYLALFGAIVEANETAILSAVRMWDSPGPYDLPTGETYLLQLQDGEGNTLASYNFDTNPHSEEGHTSEEPVAEEFIIVVPFATGTAVVEIRHARLDYLLATIPVSNNAPLVSDVTAAVEGEAVVVNWMSSDPDGDPLIWDVYYSADNGVSWQAHRLGLTKMTTSIPLSELAGGINGRFRVVAHDGVRSAQAMSDPVRIPYNAPRVHFVEPVNQHEVTYGTHISFFADVFDQQGEVDPQKTMWFINDEMVAQGSGFAHTAWLLPVGTHEVRLEVENSVGVIGSATIEVIVNDDLGYLKTKLAVGPTQLGWHVGRTTTEPQTRTIYISNVGTGLLDWEATTSASWLTLEPDPANGRLVVHADPRQIPFGENRVASILISGDNGERVEIPVSLRRGPSSNWVDVGEEYQVYLPLTVR